MTTPSPKNILSSNRSDPEELLEQFDAAWRSGVVPLIEAFAPPADDPSRHDALEELIKIDLEYRWRKTRPSNGPAVPDAPCPRLEDYVGRFPELGPLESLPMELVAEEYRVRRCWGDEPSHAEYAVRFAGHGAALRQALVRIDVELAGEPPRRDSQRLARETHTESVKTTASPPAAPPFPQIGRYELVDLLGHGAFGSVWRGWDTELKREVAVKLPRSGRFANGAEEEQFLREARYAAQLQHPGIVAVHDVGRDQDTAYIVSDLVQGVSLEKSLSAGRLDPRAAAALIAQIADALDYAHRQGVIHRDLKPANILLSDLSTNRTNRHEENKEPEKGPEAAPSPSLIRAPSCDSWIHCTPKITDFGLAKYQAAEVRVTLDGQVVGTPAYMSPEQIRRPHAVDGRSDVYSLGVILYELLTGELPFRGRTETLLVQVVAEEPRPPRQLDHKVPRDLETITLKCLAKEPDRRYLTAGELAADLRRFLNGEPIHARPVGNAERLWRWCRRNPALAFASGLAAAALLCVTVVSIVFAVDQSAAAARLTRTNTKLDRANQDLGETNDGLEQAKKRLEAALQAVEEQLAWNYLGQGLTACEQGDTGRGMLLLGRGLEVAGKAKARDLERAFRANLGHGRSQLHPLRECFDHPAPVRAVAFSPDGKMILTGCRDKTARLWDAATGKPLGQPLVHEGIINAVAFSPDGKTVLTGCQDKTARLWDTATGERLPVFLQHLDAVNAVAFSRDGKMILTGCQDGTAQQWAAATGQAVGPVLRHSKAVTTVAFSPNGKTVLTGSIDTLVQLWDAATGEALPLTLRHARPVYTAVFSPDGKTILTGAALNQAQLWDAATGEVLGQFVHINAVMSVAFSPDGKTVLTGSQDNTARLWETASRRPLGIALPHGGFVTSVAFSPDGKMILTGSTDRTARLWQVDAEEFIHPPLQHPNLVRTAVFSPDGKTVLTGSHDNKARLWDAATGKLLYDPLPHDDIVLAAAFSPDGKRIATGSQDRMVRLWEAATGQLLGEPLRHTNVVSAVTFSPDGKIVLTGCADSTARLWDAATGKPLGKPLLHPQVVRAVAFSPNGKTIVTGCVDQAARLWDAATGKPLGEPLRHANMVSAVAFSPDGKTLLTASLDKTARLWDAATGKPLGKPLQHPREVVAAVFSPDGKTILTGDWDNKARLWDAATGLQLGVVLSHQGLVSAVAFAPDGKTFLTGSHDRTVRFWKLAAPMEGEVERLFLWTQTATGMELDADGVTTVLDAATWQQRRQRLHELGGPPLP